MKSRSSCSHLAQALVIVWLLQASTLLLVSATNGEDYDSASSELYSDNTEDLPIGYSHGGPEVLHTPFRNLNYHCQACQYRSVYAMASLKSIKAHVLMKLGFDFMPNRTRYPEVPRHILESFMKQETSVRRSSTVRSTDYMEDDPSPGAEEVEEDFDYFPTMNKIYILAKRE
uniref:Uncharacterized protein n=1 Tax=Anopheles epiroticus TaxID=199890 RepID=A0A182P073_9DIPT